MKVLVLDSRSEATAEMTAAFQNSGFELALASTRDEVLFALNQESFGAVLMSLEMVRDGHAYVGELAQRFPQVKLGLISNDVSSVPAEVLQYCILGTILPPLNPDSLSMLKSSGEKASEGTGKPDLLEYISSYSSHGTDGRFTIRHQEREGSIFIHANQIAHAQVYLKEGEEAFLEIMGWKDPEIYFEANVVPPKVSIQTPVEDLLRRSAEQKKTQSLGGVAGSLVQEALNEKLVGKMVGPFQVTRRMDSDEWGVLYEALQVAVNRTVALKVLNPNWYSEQDKVYDFITFAASMARVQNPYITAVYEAGEGNGLIFYAREHVGGCNLGERIASKKWINENLALKVIANIGEALNYEAKMGVVRSPLTIDQILVPDIGVPKLLNNVTTEGSEVSPGPIDEIKRLGNFIRLGLGSAPLSGEFNVLLNTMVTVLKNPNYTWDMLLKDVKALELKRNAMKGERAMSTGRIRTIVPRKKQKGNAKSIAIGAIIALVLAAGAGGYFYFSQQPSPGDDNAMTQVPGGPFRYQEGQELVQPGFYIDRYEVTIGQYRRFLAAWEANPASIEEHPETGGKKNHTPLEWETINMVINDKKSWNGERLFENSPIFNIDFFDAWAYARWVGKRLPTEQEWEKAARGTRGNIYPWGNGPDPAKANTGSDYVKLTGPMNSEFGQMDGFGLWAPVGSMSSDRSAFGAYDMLGNVSEWTESWEMNPNLARNVPVIRGGSYLTKNPTLIMRDVQQTSSYRHRSLGFRCVSERAPLNR